VIPEQETYQQQLTRMRDEATSRATKAEADRRAAEDELGQLRRLVAQLTEQRDAARAALAALHQSEEPYEDDRLVPTPAQWIWKWNRATPAERLSRAQRILVDRDRVTLCTWEHSALLDRADRAEALAGIAESRADDWRQAHRQQVSETLRATSRAEQAEARITAAETVLHRYQGCASNTAAALRMEIREVLASTTPCARCGSPEVVYRNHQGTPLCCPCASCCPTPEAQP
jgi:hypothetical protein